MVGAGDRYGDERSLRAPLDGHHVVERDSGRSDDRSAGFDGQPWQRQPRSGAAVGQFMADPVRERGDVERALPRPVRNRVSATEVQFGQRDAVQT